jgi:uncharacterized protein YggE
MRRPTATLLALLVFPAASLTAAPLHAQSDPTPGGTLQPVPTIAVVGTGEAQVTPDRARLSIGVQTQAPTAADASARNARLQRAVIDTLRALGLRSEQIRTTGYNVFPEQTFDQPARRTRITGYNVQNTVVVELPRIDQVGPALDAVLAKGANLVSSLQFYSSDAAAVQRRAIQDAIQQARSDADAMATAAGGRLGELLELSTGVGGRPQPMYEVQMASRAARDAAPTPISEGQQTVTAMVSARWRFVPGAQPPR